MNLNNDEDLYLSPETLLALNSFLSEKEKIDESNISENWQLSQFWYSNETTEKLLEEIKLQKTESSKIVCISSPTLHVKLVENGIASTLLEFDERFDRYPRFVKYDYNYPFNLPADLEGQFDIVVVDPPFLSEECLTKTSDTVKWLLAPSKRDDLNFTQSKIILCTGFVQRDLAMSLLGVRPCQHFRPEHDSRLSNEFACFVNFDTVALDK